MYRKNLKSMNYLRDFLKEKERTLKLKEMEELEKKEQIVDDIELSDIDLDDLNNDFFDGMEDEEPEESIEKPEAIAWYYTLAIPKDRNDPYCPRLVSNATDETGLLKEMGLPIGTFFVELMDWDGLGYCQSEEEIEILYKALTGTNLEN